MIAQGSIIANTGDKLENVHPFIIEGKGHTSISNVEAFSGKNNALSNFGISQDFMLILGNELSTITMVGCRMRNYQADVPITKLNQNAIILAEACIDKFEKPFRLSQ